MCIKQAGARLRFPAIAFKIMLLFLPTIHSTFKKLLWKSVAFHQINLKIHYLRNYVYWIIGLLFNFETVWLYAFISEVQFPAFLSFLISMTK